MKVTHWFTRSFFLSILLFHPDPCDIWHICFWLLKSFKHVPYFLFRASVPFQRYTSLIFHVWCSFRLDTECECIDSCQCPCSSKDRVKLTISWLEAGCKEEIFAGKIMVLNSTRMKNDRCRIPPHLSAYNHLGRKQTTKNGSSDGLPEIGVQAETERYTENVALWPEQQSNRLGQKLGGRSCLLWLFQLQSPSCPRRCQQAQCKAELVSRVPCVLGGWGTAQQQDGGDGPDQF